MAGSNQPLSIDHCFWSRAPEVRHASLLGIRFWRSSTDGRRVGKGERADVRGGAGFGVGRPIALHRAPCHSVSCYCGVLGYEYHSLSGSPLTSQPKSMSDNAWLHQPSACLGSGSHTIFLNGSNARNSHTRPLGPFSCVKEQEPSAANWPTQPQ